MHITRNIPAEENILIFGQVDQSNEIFNFIKYEAFGKYSNIFYLPHPRDPKLY